MWLNLRYAFVVVLLLAVIFVPAKGDYKVIKVGCKEDDLRVNDTTTRDTLSDQDGGCTSANCSCHSLDDALANLTSNTVINIPYSGKVWRRESLANLANRRRFAKLKPSKLIPTIDNP